MDALWEKARDVGRMLAQTEEYRALRRANDRLADDRDTVAGINRLTELQQSIARALQGGEDPADDEREEYERLAGQVETSPVYQQYAAARANFERMMARVDEEIEKGVQAGEQSRIILTS